MTSPQDRSLTTGKIELTLIRFYSLFFSEPGIDEHEKAIMLVAYGVLPERSIPTIQHGPLQPANFRLLPRLFDVLKLAGV